MTGVFAKVRRPPRILTDDREELREAILHADGSAADLGDLHGLSARQIVRLRAQLRAAGQSVPVPNGHGEVAMGGGNHVSQGAPPNREHGRWKLPLGAEADREIHRLLTDGFSVQHAAERVGVAEGYVRAIAHEHDAPPPPHVRPELPPAEQAIALTRVDCIVAGVEIGARDCIERQCEQKCFCPKAVYAINAVAPLVRPATRLEDQVNSCRAVGRSLILHPRELHYLGPALAAKEGRHVDRSLFPGELPAPPQREAPAAVRAPVAAAPQRCSVPDCEAPLTAKAVDGLCGRHAEARRRQLAATPPPGRPAAPAQEKQMGLKGPKTKLDNISDDAIRTSHKELGGNLSALGRHFSVSAATVKNRLVRLGIIDGPTTPSKQPAAPPKLAAVPPPAPPKPTIGEHHHVELPAVEQLPLEYLLACVDYARAAQARISAALSGGGEISQVRSTG